MTLPKPPAEPPRIFSLDGLAPKFREAVVAIVAEVETKGFKVKVFESLRTDERQAWLFGFGRTWDDPNDPRGAVTKAETGDHGWHKYGCAVDIVENDATPWRAAQALWQEIGLAAERHGCTWGGRWHRVDLPHVQAGECTQAPTDEDIRILRSQGKEAVWAALGIG